MTDEEKGLAGAASSGHTWAGCRPWSVSLFLMKAAHWRDGIRGVELGARGKERTARQLRVIRVKRLRLTRPRSGPPPPRLQRARESKIGYEQRA